MAETNEQLNNHAGFIWSVADLLRGNYKQSEYGPVILPLTVLRRLDCVLDPDHLADDLRSFIHDKFDLAPQITRLDSANLLYLVVSKLPRSTSTPTRFQTSKWATSTKS